MGCPVNSDFIPSMCHIKKEDSEEDEDHLLHNNELHIKEEYYPECTFEMEVSEEEDIKPTVNHLKQEADLILEVKSSQQDANICCPKQEVELNLEGKLISENGKCSATTFSCNYCDEGFKSVSYLKSHTVKYHLEDTVITKTTTHDKKYFQCSQCDFKHAKLCTLKTHIVAKHTEQKPYKCTHCNYRTAYPNTCKEHFLAKHTNYKPHKCSLCDYKAVQSTHLRRHMRTRHTKPQMCTSCSYSTIDENVLKDHILKKHTKKSICDNKTEEVSYFSLIISNQEDKSISKEKSTRPNEMVIEEEGTNRNSLVNSLKQKSIVILDEKPKTGYEIRSDNVASCYFCNKAFKTASSLRSHIVLHHLEASIITNNDPQDKKFLMCSFCDYKDTKHSKLELHLIARHTKQKLYQCSICQYKTAYVSSLRYHKLAKHTLKKPHQCMFCDFKTMKAANLKRHIFANHKCTFCDYSSVSRKALRDHIFTKHNKKNKGIYSSPLVTMKLNSSLI